MLAALVMSAALLLCAGLVRPALAEDFFFNLFGGFGPHPAGPTRMGIEPGGGVSGGMLVYHERHPFAT